MGGYPIDHISERPRKRDEKHILKEMGDFADFMKQLEKTHAWDEAAKDFVPRKDIEPKGAHK